MKNKDFLTLDEVFPELTDYVPPLHRRIWNWLIVEWANLKGRIRQEETPWVIFYPVDEKLPEESGEYHVFYKIQDVDHLVECLIRWDNEKQVWDVPPTWNNENVWHWSPTYRSRKIQ